MQKPLEALVGAMKTDLRRRGRNAEGSADLEVRPSVHVFHHHDSSQTRRKLTEGLPEAMPEIELVDPAFWLGGVVIFGFNNFGKRGRRMAGVAPAGGSGGVDRDAVKPSGESRIPSEGGKSPPYPNPGLLGDVGGELVVVGEAIRQAVDITTVATEQLCECRTITAAGQRNQFLIIG